MAGKDQAKQCLIKFSFDNIELHWKGLHCVPPSHLSWTFAMKKISEWNFYGKKCGNWTEDDHGNCNSIELN